MVKAMVHCSISVMVEEAFLFLVTVTTEFSMDKTSGSSSIFDRFLGSSLAFSKPNPTGSLSRSWGVYYPGRALLETQGW